MVSYEDRLRDHIREGVRRARAILDDIKHLPETSPRIAPQSIHELDDWQSDMHVDVLGDHE